MSYGKMFSLMKMAADQEWQAYTKHEFISQLSSGKLPDEKSFNYLIQDYLFLIQFSGVCVYSFECEAMATTLTAE
jgi:thiaminase/transcriptional activator TenA